MTTSIITRLGKGTPLSFIDMDGNLVNLQSATDTVTSTVSGVISDTTSIHNQISAINLQITTLPTVTYVDTHFGSKLLDTSARVDQSVAVYDGTSNTYKHVPIASIIGSSTPTTPARWTYVSSVQTILAGQAIDLSTTIPNVRLYGVKVSVTGLASNQTMTTVLYGNAAKTDQQYSANFNFNLLSDTSQAWMYRNDDGQLFMYIRVINTSATNITNFVVTIIAEPF